MCVKRTFPCNTALFLGKSALSVLLAEVLMHQPSSCKSSSAQPQGSLLAGGWNPLLLAAKSAAQQSSAKPVLIAAANSIPHSLLLADCSGVIHHGGAGICAAVLHAGLPHIVCPFHFDQFSWV